MCVQARQTISSCPVTCHVDDSLTHECVHSRTHTYIRRPLPWPLSQYLVSRSLQIRMRSPQPRITSVFPSTIWRELPYLRVGWHSKFRPRHWAGLSIELNLFSRLPTARHPSSETHEHMNLTVGMNSYLMQFFRRRNCLFSTTIPTESTRLSMILRQLKFPCRLSCYISGHCVWANLYTDLTTSFLPDHSHLLGWESVLWCRKVCLRWAQYYHHTPRRLSICRRGSVMKFWNHTSPKIASIYLNSQDL